MWNMTFKMLDTIMTLVDSDNSGTIGFEEFLRTAVKPEDICNKNILTKAFSDFDVDGNEDLSIKEIKTRLNPKNKPVPDALWEGLFMLSIQEQDDPEI